MRTCFRILFFVLNLFVAIGLIISAYGGMINPDNIPVAGIVAMTFVVWIILSIVLLTIDLLIDWRFLWIQIFALLACSGPLRTFCPLNFGLGNLTDEEQQRSFTVLNYNVEGFYDDKNNAESGYNRTVRYILETNADIVCLQECYEFKELKELGLRQSQIDSMHVRYPYSEINSYGQGIFSKYPFTRVDLPVTLFDNGDFEAFTLMIEGRILNIFNVHLQSIGLTPDDKQLYMSLTRKPSEVRLRQAKSQLLSKLCYGFKQRAIQARALKEYIDIIGGNIIVCGDFNDIPGCYAIRILEKSGLHDAYTDAAFGPTITYHANRFYFRIDQALYKGDFEAVKCVRGNVDSSDHYPLLTTYLWK